MAFKYNGKEVASWFYKGKEVTDIIKNRKELHTAGNFVTADGYIIQTADGFTFNVAENQ